MSDHPVTREGPQGVRPQTEALTGVHVGPGGSPRPGGRWQRRRRGEVPMVPDASFSSYYGKPVINQPTWQAPDIPGYLFLGGLAGAGSVVAAGAHLTGRSALARTTKVGATVAVGLSFGALVHDLGRPGRFLNMLRTFKVTSPMSVGTWLLSAYAPAATLAAVSDLTGAAMPLGVLATAAAAVVGPAVACYTAALVSDTAVPAWHGGYREMPFLFASSAMSAAAGLGLLGAPLEESGPVRRLGVLAGAAELVVDAIMVRRMGLPGEAYGEGRAKSTGRGARLATAAGVATAALLGRRSRAAAAAAGAALLVGSALTRFSVFEAGIGSSKDPRYTVVPQRQRLQARAGAPG